MNEFVISLCGRQRAGKTTLMDSMRSWLLQTKGADCTGQSFRDNRSFHGYHLNVLVDGEKYRFAWIGGVAMDDRAAQQWVVEQSQVIVYQFDPISNDQTEYFENHQAVAARLGKLPPAVPWMFVLNLKDPLHFWQDPPPYPADLKHSLLHLNAKTGEGVDRFWLAIQEMKKNGGG